MRMRMGWGWGWGGGYLLLFRYGVNSSGGFVDGATVLLVAGG